MVMGHLRNRLQVAPEMFFPNHFSVGHLLVTVKEVSFSRGLFFFDYHPVDMPTRPDATVIMT